MITEEQRKIRRSGIGGSDAPAILGLDEYRQPLDIYMAKVEGIETDISDKEVIRWGNLLESVVAEEWARRTGNILLTADGTFRHAEHPFMIGHVDGVVAGDDAGLEIKTRGTFNASDYGPSGSDEYKRTDFIQCQHYMGVTGWRKWHLAVLIGGQDLRHYEIPRHERLIDLLIEEEREFWRRVETRNPPVLNYWHQSSQRLVKELHPGTTGESIDLPERFIEINKKMENLKQQKKKIDEQLEGIKNMIADAIGDGAQGVLPDGSGGWARKKISRKGYTVAPSEYFDIRFSKRLT